MQKEINCKIRLVLKGGEANPGLKQIGPQLGGKVGNIMDFCKQFNAQTSERKGVSLRVVVTAYKNKEKSFDFIILMVFSNLLMPSSAKYSACTGMITESAAVSALIVINPNDGEQSIRI